MDTSMTRLRGDCLNRRATFRPDTENVSSGVHVAIMQRAAVRAFPPSYSERAHTFRAACGDRPASRARPGSISLVDFRVFNSVPNGLVAEHFAERRPTSIQHRLRHSGFDEFRCRYVPDNDALVGSHQIGGHFVQMVASSVRDLGVDRGYAAPVARALRNSEPSGIPFDVPQVRDCLAVTSGRQRFKPEVDADLSGAVRANLIRLKQNVEVPPTAGITGKSERLRLGVAGQIARPPKAIVPLAKSRPPPIQEKTIVCVQRRNPVEILACASPSRASLLGVSRRHELTTDCVDGDRQNSQFLTGSRSQSNKIEKRRPPAALARQSCLPSTLGLSLDLAAIIPDEIDRRRLSTERPLRRGRAVFDSVAVGQDHEEILQ